jgi:hypothetical protein
MDTKAITEYERRVARRQQGRRAQVPQERREVSPAPDDPEHLRWLDGIVGLAEGAQLRGISLDTLRREHRKGRVEFLQMSEGRWGIRRRVALMLD